MDPDWYVDPLGRYEGRYWDGEQWTERVKDRGRLVVDPDWPPDLPDGAESGATAESESAVETESGVESESMAGAFRGSGSESPTRRVAVLRGAADSVDHEPHPLDELAGPLEPQSMPTADRRRRITMLVGAAIVVIGLLLVVVPRLVGDDGTDAPVASDGRAGADDAILPGTTVDASDEAQEAEAQPSQPPGQRAEEDGDADSDGATGSGAADSDGAAGSGATGSDAAGSGAAGSGADASGEADAVTVPAGAVVVGALAVADGRLVLQELADWHGTSLVGRGIVLGQDAGCWFGRIGEAVVQNAHCGPVSTADDEEPMFDLVPLRFDDIIDGVVEVRAITDAAVIDAVLPNGLELIGADGPVDIDALAPAAENSDLGESGADGERGERDGG